MSKIQIKLAGVRNELEQINISLQNRCGPFYFLELMQYRFRPINASVYDETSNDYDIILCLYHNNKCISSVTGRYNPINNSMELLSKTDKLYEGLKYNLYVRTIFIYLMCFVTPRIKNIISYATNPISTYVMYKHYYAKNIDLQEYVLNHNLTPNTFTLQDSIHFHEYYAEKYKQTPESAQFILEEMLEECSIFYDKICKVKDLGFKTKEDVFNFIMTTMNNKEITLEIDLGFSIQEFLFNKINKIGKEIICIDNHNQLPIKKQFGGNLYRNNKYYRNNKSYRYNRNKSYRYNRNKSYRYNRNKSYRCNRNKSYRKY